MAKSKRLSKADTRGIAAPGERHVTAPDSNLVAFIGSYTPADQPGIFAVTVDRDSGLRMYAAWAGVTNPSFLTIHPNGRHLYAVSETGLVADGTSGTVHAFDIERSGATIELAPLGRRPTSGDHPCHLRVDPDGRWLAVSNYGTGSLVVLPIRPDGSLDGVASLVQHRGTGPIAGRQDGPHTHSSVFAPDGRFLIAADLGVDQILVYEFDSDTGSLNGRHVIRTAPGAGPRHLAFHPDGSHLFVANELDNTVSLFGFDGDDGSLHLRQSESTVPPQWPHNTVGDIHVSDAGDRVYVSNRGHDSLAAFEFHSTEGLTRRTLRSCAGRVPRGFRLVPGADQALVANQESDEVVALSLTAHAALDPVARLHILRPSCVTLLMPNRPRRAGTPALGDGPEVTSTHICHTL